MWIVAWNVIGKDSFAIYEGFGEAAAHYKEVLEVPGLVSVFLGPVTDSHGYAVRPYPTAPSARQVDPTGDFERAYREAAGLPRGDDG